MIEFIAGLGMAYVSVGLGLLVRDASAMRVRGLGDYPRWPVVLWREWESRPTK